MAKIYYKLFVLVILLIIPSLLFLYYVKNDVSEILFDDMSENNGLLYELETFEENNNYYSLEGWLIFPGHDQAINLYNKKVWLLSSKTARMYECKTTAKYNFSPQVNDGGNYYISGFKCDIPKKIIEKAGGEAEVCLCYVYNGINYYVHTGQFVFAE